MNDFNSEVKNAERRLPMSEQIPREIEVSPPSSNSLSAEQQMVERQINDKLKSNGITERSRLRMSLKKTKEQQDKDRSARLLLQQVPC